MKILPVVAAVVIAVLVGVGVATILERLAGREIGYHVVMAVSLLVVAGAFGVLIVHMEDKGGDP